MRIDTENRGFKIRFLLACLLAISIIVVAGTSICSAFAQKATLSSATAGSTCKITSNGSTTYYSTLVEAVAGAQTGDTIEIFKAHSVDSAFDTADKDITIQNIVNPSDESENPAKNGSESNPPVVSFAQTARMSINSDVTFKGVIIDGGGDRSGGGGTHRSESGFYVGAGHTLNIEDGAAGTLDATTTIIRNFTNDSEVPTDAKSGGAFYVDGTINMNGGTISGCVGVKRNYDIVGDENLGGGAVAAIMSGGTFNFTGGKITQNGLYEQGSHGACAIDVKGGTFNMTGGIATGNYGNHGGFLIAVADTTCSVNITGGTITNNIAYWDGGALFIGDRTGGASNCVVGGTAEISGNCSRRNAGAISVRNCGNLTLSGSAVIRDNNGGSEVTPINYGAAIEAYDYDSEGTVTIAGNPVVYKNTTGGSTEADINIGNAASFLVGDVGTEAKIGVCFPDTKSESRASGAQFATSNGKDASQISLLEGVFCNTADMKYVSAAGEGTAIVWTESLCKVVQNKSDIVGARAFTSLTGLAYFCNTVNMAYIPDNIIKIEMLVSEYTLDRETYIERLSADRHSKLTTAKSDATDGYPYRGDASVENGRCVIKRGFWGDAMFKMRNGGNYTFSIENIIIDGQKDTYSMSSGQQLRAVFVGIGSTFIMEEGATIRNSVSGSNGTVRGGAVYIQGDDSGYTSQTTTFKMKEGSEITGCDSIEGGGIWVYGTNSSQNPVVEIDGGKITNCTATDCGAAMSGQGITIKGNSEISGNTAKSMSAISLNSWGAISISGKTKITGNTTTGSDSGAIGVKSNAKATSRITLSGSVIIYDNLNSSGAQANFFENSASDSGSRLYVGDDGLTSAAKIGVSSQNSSTEGLTFGRTNADTAISVSDLSVFKNDKNSDLISLAGDDNRVVWSNLEPVTLKAEINEAQVDDTWITFQITQKNSGETYRQSVKVSAGSTTGEATVMLYSGRTYEINQRSSESSWRFSADSVLYTNSKSDSGTDEWSATSENVPASLEMFNPTNTTQTRVVTVKSNCVNNWWQSFVASVVNTMS